MILTPLVFFVFVSSCPRLHFGMAVADGIGMESAHTQAVAYVIGETAAEKIVAEYK